MSAERSPRYKSPQIAASEPHPSLGDADSSEALKESGSSRSAAEDMSSIGPGHDREHLSTGPTYAGFVRDRGGLCVAKEVGPHSSLLSTHVDRPRWYLRILRICLLCSHVWTLCFQSLRYLPHAFAGNAQHQGTWTSGRHLSLRAARMGFCGNRAEPRALSAQSGGPTRDWSICASAPAHWTRPQASSCKAAHPKHSPSDIVMYREL